MFQKINNYWAQNRTLKMGVGHLIKFLIFKNHIFENCYSKVHVFEKLSVLKIFCDKWKKPAEWISN